MGLTDNTQNNTATVQPVAVDNQSIAGDFFSKLLQQAGQYAPTVVGGMARNSVGAGGVLGQLAINSGTQIGQSMGNVLNMPATTSSDDLNKAISQQFANVHPFESYMDGYAGGFKERGKADATNGKPPQPIPPAATPNTPNPSQDDANNTLDDTVTVGDNTPPQVNLNGSPVVRGEQKGFWQQFLPGSDTMQPGDIYKVITMLAGGGAYKPSTDTAYNAEVLQKMLGQQPMQASSRQEAMYNMISSLPDNITKNTESLGTAAKTLDGLLTPGERAMVMMGKLPPSLMAIKQGLGGKTIDGQQKGGVYSKQQQALKLKLDTITKMMREGRNQQVGQGEVFVDGRNHVLRKRGGR